MRKTLARLMLPILLLGLASCGGNDEETLAHLARAMTSVKVSAEAVLTGKQPLTALGLAALSRQVAAADGAVDLAERTARSLAETSTIRAATLDYLATVRGAVDQTRERYATAIALEEAKAQDRTVPAAIDQARDEATLERVRVDADAKARAVAAAVNRAGNAVVERERRLEALMTALQHDAQPLAGYALVSHDALAAAMASNVTAGH